MSLDKAIAKGREHRRAYRLPKSVDGSTRNHGSCPWARGNRVRDVRLANAKAALLAYQRGDDADTE